MPGMLLWQHEGSKRMSEYKLSNMAVSDGEKTCGRWISRRSSFILKKAELAQGFLRNRHRINTVWKGLQSYGKRTITNQKNRRSPRRLRAKYTQCTNQRFMRWVFRPAGLGQKGDAKHRQTCIYQHEQAIQCQGSHHLYHKYCKAGKSVCSVQHLWAAFLE